MSKRQESLNPAENRKELTPGGVRGVFKKKGKPQVLAFLVGKVLLWYGIRENLLWLCGYYIEKASGLQVFPE